VGDANSQGGNLPCQIGAAHSKRFFSGANGTTVRRDLRADQAPGIQRTVKAASDQTKAVMKTAQPGIGAHRRKRRGSVFHRPSTGRVFVQGIMDPVIVVDGDCISAGPRPCALPGGRARPPTPFVPNRCADAVHAIPRDGLVHPRV
jgi:hypothetical protein